MRNINEKIIFSKLSDPNYLIIVSIFFGMVFFSCDGSYEPMDNQIKMNVPYGIWVYRGTTGKTEYYFAAGRFDPDKRGIAFKRENIYIERTAGWCGTPPVTYFNSEGNWELMSENKLKVTCYNYLDSERILEILYLSDTELRLVIYPYSDK